MARFVIVEDDQHQAFVNADMICMYRVKLTDDGKAIADPPEVEIDFVGGTKTKLHGEPAKHFLIVMKKILVQ